jgi:uncharacterized protein (DUF1330 family)
MTVFMIIQIEVKDTKLYSQYTQDVKGVVEEYGGRYLVRGGPVTPLSGGWNPERIILIEFSSPEVLRSCFRSEQYHKLASLRERSTIGKSIMVEGLSHTE